MNYFGTYSHFHMISIATIGSLLGSMTNWYLGRMLLFAKMGYEKRTIKPQNKLSQNISLILTLCFVWMPHIGGVITLFSGCVAEKLYKIALAAAISHLLFFIYLINL
jgi:membrane protein YqaA with SNARE-associated domain